MNADAYKSIDLNLLQVFAVVMHAPSVTAAAERLGISQSAVSQGLKRLREMIGDELFLRDRTGIVPTPRAKSLYHDIMPALNLIENSLRNNVTFEPRTSSRKFRIRLLTAQCARLTAEILRLLESQAPLLDLSFTTGGVDDGIYGFLDREEYDVVIGAYAQPLQALSWHRFTELPDAPMLCIYDGERLGIDAPITLEQYVSMPHLKPLLMMERKSMIEEGLEAIGHKRPRVIVTDDFSGMPFCLKKIDALANLPAPTARLFAKACDLTVSELPLKVSNYKTALYWHGKSDADPGHSWLRSRIIEAANNLSDE